MKDGHKCGREVIHGHSQGGVKSLTYNSWDNMMQRCYNPKKDGFSHYGGRGICVALPWHTFQTFLVAMGERPEGTTLNRLDSNGDYEPGNCEWERSWKKQCFNRGHTRVIEVDGEQMCGSDFARFIGVVPSTIHNAFSKGWSAEQVRDYYLTKYKKTKGELL